MSRRLSPTAILRNGLRFLVPLAIALTVHLYLYPVFSTCGFPLPPSRDGSPAIAMSADTGRAAFIETAKLHWPLPDKPKTNTSRPLAPFRLLALGDPQLEGDTSIPTDYLGTFPHVASLFRHVTLQSHHASLRQRVRECLHDVVDILLEDTFNLLESWRKRIDLFGNDFYLAHIYRTLHWWTKPTHVTVLGDLVGSQWLDDKEFLRRANRYWQRVFRGAERVPDHVATFPAEEYDLTGYLHAEGREEEEDIDAKIWTRRIINVAGNHDIGYAGDINSNRTERFESAFGKVNYELRFELNNTATSAIIPVYDPVSNPTSNLLAPELRIVVLNDMNLDTPALSPELQDATYSFVNSVINTAAAVEFKGHFTVVLTHVPLFKPMGVCVDDPMFDFHEHDGTLKEQNQLSAAASRGFLEGILGMSGDVNAPARGRGRQGIILNGHDHEGCDTWHHINQTIPAGDEKEWEVRRWRQATKMGLVGQEDMPGVREITVRSMMGDFGGNAGLLSVWFDEDTWQWKTEYASCPLGTQHMWWVVHILDLGVLLGVLLSIISVLLVAAGVDVDEVIIEGIQRLWRGSFKTKTGTAGNGTENEDVIKAS